MERPTFDTSGEIFVLGGSRRRGLRMVWADLTPFEQGYVEALFADNERSIVEQFAAIGQSEPWGHPDCAKLAFSDLSPEALARIRADCASMENIAGGVGISKLDEAKGRNFWNGRKAGGYGLAPVVATAFPPLTPFLSEDGKIHLQEAQS